MIGYCRSFCCNFATIAAPLTHLLSPNVLFFYQEMRSAKMLLKVDCLVMPLCLQLQILNKPSKFAVDASDVGAGAVLLQDDIHGVEHHMCYFEKKCDVHQKHYSTMEKEALALILALRHFDVYVSGAPLLVSTDHNPLVSINSMRGSNQRLMQWRL